MPGRATGVLAALLLSTAMIGPATAETLDGAQLYMEFNCIQCHGPGGRAPSGPRYPKLAGQNEAYLFAQLVDFQEGRRNNGLSGLMRAMVSRLTVRELQAISRYLSRQN